MGAPKDPEKYKEFIRKMKLLRGEKSPNFGRKHTIETRKLLSESHKGIKQSPEWIAKRIAATIASPNRGLKISVANKGKKYPKEFGEKISRANKGRKRSIETRRKMSISHMGKKRPPRSEQWRKRQSISQKSRISSTVLIALRIKTWFYKLPMRKLKRKSPTMSKELLEKKRAVCKNRIWTQESRDKIKLKRVNWTIPYEDTKPERLMQLALTLKGIKFEKHKPFKLGKYWHKVDIFIEPNIIVEVDGVHWHLMTMKDVINDLFQSQELTVMGYHVIRIRDKDILKNKNNCADKVIQLIKELQHRFLPIG